MLIPSLQTLILDLPPSCIKFHPTNPNIFVIGTYKLHSQTQEETAYPQKRTGSLLVFRLSSSSSETGEAGSSENVKDETSISFTQISSKSTPWAVLDLQWSPSDPDVLAVATSTGGVAVYRLVGNELVEQGSVRRVTEPEILVLSLEWCGEVKGVVGVGLSDGRVCVCEVGGDDDDGEEVVDGEGMEVHSHELEAWVLAFLPGEDEDGGGRRRRIVSGGDDGVLQCSSWELTKKKIHDQEDGEDGREGGVSSTFLWKDRKIHQAGITFILPLPVPRTALEQESQGDLVVTGSYDDHIRLLSLPSATSAIRRPRVLAEQNLGGGVWRLKILSSSSSPPNNSSPTSSSYSIILLASCMHAGSRIVRLSHHNDPTAAEGSGPSSWTFEILARFEEHESMNYGSDVQPKVANQNESSVHDDSNDNCSRAIVSTSFYDRRVCLWRFQDNRYQTK